MNAVAKFAFVTLVAATLFFTPLGACANTVKAGEAPAHPCCPPKPASIPEDCARPGCIYMDTHVVPSAIAPFEDATPIGALPTSAVLAKIEHSVAFDAFAFEEPPLILHHRFIAFHQFLL